jgi:tape measure domain-containing protein
VATDRNVQLGIEVATRGDDDVKRLAGTVRELGMAGDAAAAPLSDTAAALDRLTAEAEQAQAVTKRLREAEAALSAEAREQKAAIGAKSDELRRLKVSTDAAGRATAEHQQAERVLKLALIDANAALRANKEALAQATANRRAAAASEAALRNELQMAAAAHRQVGVAAQQAGVQQATASEIARRATAALGDQLRTVQTLASAGIAGFAGGALVADVARTADAYSNLAARIRLVTGEGAAFDAAFEGVQQIAQRTNSTLDATGTLFGRIATAGREIGVSQRDALALTESINQAVQLSGSSAEASNAAIVQLVQGLQSGVLRGEEFNSVMEQAPRLAQALAAGLGVTTGELRKLAAAGSLTSGTVIAALQGQSAAIRREFEQLPPTVGRAIQNLSTAWTLYVGSADAGTGASAAAARAINSLAANLGTLAELLYGAGKAAVALKAAQLAGEFLGVGRAAKLAAVEVAAANTALAASGAAGATAAAGVGRFAGLLAGLKAFTLAGVVTNIESLGTAIGEGAARLLGYGRAEKELEAQLQASDAAARAAAQSRAELAQRTKQAADQALALSTEAKKLVADFEGMRAKGESVSDALEKVAKSLRLDDLTGIRDAGAALDALGVRGRLTGQQIRDALSAALKDTDLAAFEAQARAAFDASEQGARRLQAAIDAIATESLRRAGTSADELRTGFSAAATSAINDVDALVSSLDQLGLKGADAGRAVARALDRAVDAAATERAVQAVIDRYEALGHEGLIAGDRLAEGMQRAREKLDELTPGVDSLSEALRNFGLKSREELQATADKLGESYRQIAGNVNVSLRDQMTALQQYKEAALAAGDQAALGQIKVQEEVLRTRASVAGLGDEFERQFDRGAKGAESFVESVLRAQRALDRLNSTAGPSNLSSGLDQRNQNLRSSSGDNVGEDGFVTDGTRDLATGLLVLRKGAAERLSIPSSGTSRSTAQPVSSTPVSIVINGRRSEVNVATRADADKLSDLLRQLQDDFARSGG